MFQFGDTWRHFKKKIIIVLKKWGKKKVKTDRQIQQIVGIYFIEYWHDRSVVDFLQRPQATAIHQLIGFFYREYHKDES